LDNIHAQSKSAKQASSRHKDKLEKIHRVIDEYERSKVARSPHMEQIKQIMGRRGNVVER
jgi:hypothetical protein